MLSLPYLPEGELMESAQNRLYCNSAEGLLSAMAEGRILEGCCTLCDRDHNLIVPLGPIKGIIPKAHAAMPPPGAPLKDIAIISRVNRPVCFKVIKVDEGSGVALLSRRQAQEECAAFLINTLKPGDVIKAKVTHLDRFGCFCDIGCGVVSLLNIENISVSRISHPSDRFTEGQEIRACVLSLDKEQQRVTLTHKELLGTWLENAARFGAGETVTGIVRSIESYGVFIELTPNLAGLSEVRDGLFRGQRVSVYIKNILPGRMKVKLNIIAAFDKAPGPRPFCYFVKAPHIDSWVYTPPQCPGKVIETVF